MAVAGQPVAGRHLSCRYSSQSVYGTAVTPATSPGIVSFDVTSDAGTQSVFNIGAANSKFLKPGIATVPWSVNVLAVQTKAVLELGERTTGTLPWLTWEFGTAFDSGTNHAFQVQDCKVHNLEISQEAGGFLQASLSGVGGLITDLSTVAMAHLTATPMYSYESVMLKGVAAWELRGFRMSVNHNVSVDSVIPGAASATFKRGWAYQTEGQEEVTGELTRFIRSSIDLQATTLSEFTLLLTATDIVGGMTPTTIIITLTGAKFGQERFAGTVDGLATYTTPFSALSFTVT